MFFSEFFTERRAHDHSANARGSAKVSFSRFPPRGMDRYALGVVSDFSGFCITRECGIVTWIDLCHCDLRSNAVLLKAGCRVYAIVTPLLSPRM